MTLQRTGFSLILASASWMAHAQVVPTSFVRAQWPVAFENEGPLTNPWVGGLTAPQWSPIDADLDGDEDLFAFDRDGSRLLVFERIPSETNAEGNLVMRWDWVEGGQKWLIGACCAITTATASRTSSPATKTAYACSPTPRPSEDLQPSIPTLWT